MRGLDARLLRCGRPTRVYLAASVVLGSTRALLVVAQAWLLATVVARTFIGKQSLTQVRGALSLLLVVAALRAVVVWSSEVAADRCSARVKSQMRSSLVRRAGYSRPDDREGAGTGDVATLAVRGIDALDGYFARYLPQVFLAVIVPVTVLVAVLTVDWVSALIIALTLPLIPIFMGLIGLGTKAHTDRQLRTLQVLSGHFLDVVSGLPTLKIFGRSKVQARTIGEVTDRYRKTTMSALRLTFLSSLALELLASLSVALVAVAIGLRLLAGHLDLRSALFVLLLAPEAYLPLRHLGAEFHASAEGVSAADKVFEVIDVPLSPHPIRTDFPNPATTEITFESVRVVYPGRKVAALDSASLTVGPGEVLAITGPSGCGKSTLLAALLGLVELDAGTIRVGNVDVATLDREAWRKQIAWVPQRPHLFTGTLADNIRLGRKDAPVSVVEEAVADAGLSGLVRHLPRGLDTVLGDGGAGLSAGERRRVALARAFLRDASLLLLDEPTAGLDGQTESEVIDTVRRMSAARTVVLVAHRPALLAVADRVVELSLAGSAA
jgi:thiol reductant ABC exporter CydD subunit